MKRPMAIVSLLITVVLATAALADPPDRLRSYNIIPRLSVLGQTGGFAGVTNWFRLTGSFDLHEQFNYNWGYDVSLTNTEVWGSIISDQPTIAIVTDVDELLNLEGLKGKALPTAGPLPVYEFKGELADGSSMRILGLDRGRWLYLRGSSTPPPGGADFFEYQLRILARLAPSGDANGDGAVDAADYTLLRDAGGPVNAAAADGVSISDWFEQFGETPPDIDALDAQLNAALLPSATAVPEPGAMVVVAFLVGAAALRRSKP